VVEKHTVLSPDQWAYLRRHRVARLATVDRNGVPSLVPLCFADDGVAIYSALDAKPKRVAPTDLKRVRNLCENPNMAFLVDDYAEDWTRLAYLTIHGLASLVEPGTAEHTRAVALLRQKYPQYDTMPIEEQPVIRIEPTSAKSWGRILADPSTTLTAAEQDALRRGGVNLEPVESSKADPLLRTAAEYAALLASAYSVNQAAAILHVEPSRIRQRLAAHSLYGVKEHSNWRLPRFQFENGQLVPNINAVFARLRSELHPVGVWR
jgi:PPOX class probable F420-dependent enzyme